MAAQNETIPDDDNDSALGECDDSSTISLSSSVASFPVENGRSYHSYHEGSYLQPNDQPERDRLLVQHEIWRMLLEGKLYLAPVKMPERVLDLATGTGTWAIEFGDLNPQSTVLGTDLSPIQPTQVPPNVSFQVDDFEDGWSFTYKFDFIHARMLATSVRFQDRLFQEAKDSLNPGGWLEIQDFSLPRSSDASIPENSAYRLWIGHLEEGLKIAGRNGCAAENYEDILQTTGFINIRVVKKWLPQNPWPRHKTQKLLGKWQEANILMGLDGFSLRVFTKYLAWPLERFQAFSAEVKKDISDRRIHAYWPVVVVYAQKPHAEAETLKPTLI